MISGTFKFQIFEATSATFNNSRRPDSIAIHKYIIINSATNTDESFALDTLQKLVYQNILHKKPSSSRDSFYIVKSNAVMKIETPNTPVVCETPLKSMQGNMPGFRQN